MVQLGSYAVPLPTVAENQVYPELGALAEAKVTFTVAKHGGFVPYTFELFKGDNVGLLQRIVEALADLGRTSFAQAVWGPWNDNALFAEDAKAWFHVDHGNLQTGPLTEPNLVAAITKLVNQTPLGASRVVANPVQVGRIYLDVPPALWDTARRLNFTLGSAVYGLFGDQGQHILVNSVLTSATAWGVHRVPQDSESLRVDFMDGEEEPQLLHAAEPNGGSLFTNDRYVYRLGHWYGVGLVDYRGAVKSTGV